MMTNKPEKTSKTPAVPRPSASLIIVNSQNEILLVQRNPKATSFPGFHVFPGGNSDPEDDSHKITAIRETFEESGLLLASGSNKQLDEEQLTKARFSLLKNETTFNKFLSENGLKPDVDDLIPFSQWITPPGIPRRFHTHFFLTFLPATLSTGPGFTSGSKQQFLPTPDGGQEIVSATFIHPHEALSQSLSTSPGIRLMMPQFYLLTTLAAVLVGKENTREQKEKVEKLARGSFGSMVINPRPLVPLPEEMPKDQTVLTFEGDETRGGNPGKRHRALLRVAPHGMTAVKLDRNLDMFAEMNSLACTKL